MRRATTLLPVLLLLLALPARAQFKSNDYDRYRGARCPAPVSDSLRLEIGAYHVHRACPDDPDQMKTYEQLRNRVYTYEEGYRAATAEVDGRDGDGWFFYGLAGGLITGPVGGLYVLDEASDDDDQSLANRRYFEVNTTRSMDYCDGYSHAWNDRYYDKRQQKAWIGALTGTGLLAGVITFLAIR